MKPGRNTYIRLSQGNLKGILPFWIKCSVPPFSIWQECQLLWWSSEGTKATPRRTGSEDASVICRWHRELTLQQVLLVQNFATHRHRAKYGSSKEFYKIEVIRNIGWFVSFINIGKKKKQAWCHLASRAHHSPGPPPTLPHRLLLLSLPCWPLPQHPNVLVLEGPRAWCSALTSLSPSFPQ